MPEELAVSAVNKLDAAVPSYFMEDDEGALLDIVKDEIECQVAIRFKDPTASAVNETLVDAK